MSSRHDKRVRKRERERSTQADAISLLEEAKPEPKVQKIELPEDECSDLLEAALAEPEPDEPTPMRGVEQDVQDAPRKRASYPAPSEADEERSFRRRRDKRLVPELPPITPASQWGGV